MGLLITRSIPKYPAIAEAIALRGTVVLAGDDLEERDHRESARGERTRDVAAGGARCGEAVALSAVPAERRAGGGGDHGECGVHTQLTVGPGPGHLEQALVRGVRDLDSETGETRGAVTKLARLARDRCSSVTMALPWQRHAPRFLDSCRNRRLQRSHSGPLQRRICGIGTAMRVFIASHAATGFWLRLGSPRPRR